jgi:hypothetical protein
MEAKDNNELLVFICDNRLFSFATAKFLKQNGQKLLDTYDSSESFLEKLSQYTKDTKICIDNSIKPKMSSLTLAKKLHEAGYTRLYLLSGWNFVKDKYERTRPPAPYEIPDYLTAIYKDSDDILKML